MVFSDVNEEQCSGFVGKLKKKQENKLNSFLGYSVATLTLHNKGIGMQDLSSSHRT